MAWSKTIIGVLIVLAMTGVIIVMNSQYDVSLEVNKNVTIFRISNQTAAIERVYIDGVSMTSSVSKSILLNNIKVTRTSKGSNITISHKYLFNANSTNIEDFPIAETITVSKAKGKILYYNVNFTPEYRKRMNVQYDSNQCQLMDDFLLKCPITKATQVFNIRMFDPLEDCQEINDSNIFIKACPTTMTSSGWVDVNLTSKLYTGPIDFAIGVNSNNAVMTGFEVQRNVTVINESINTTILEYYPFNLSTINYNYDGKDTWSIGQNVQVVAGQEYKARFYLNIIPDTNGKYDIALKPSSESIAQAIANNHLYVLDPWWNSTTEVILQSVQYNPWSSLDNGSSTLRFRGVYYEQNHLLALYGGENSINDETGQSAADASSGTITYIPGKINTAFNFSATGYTTSSKTYNMNVDKTTCAWINVATGEKAIIGYPNGVYEAICMGVCGFGDAGVGIGKIKYAKYDTNWDIIYSTTSYVAGTWYRVCTAYDKTNSQMRLYVNGVNEANGTNSGAVANYQQSICLVAAVQCNAGTLVDEVAVYDYDFTSVDAVSDYNNGSGRKYASSNLQLDYPYSSNLVAYWRFENNSLEEKYSYSGINQGVTYTNGKLGSASTFTTGSNITFATTGALASYTLNAWINLTSLPINGQYRNIASNSINYIGILNNSGTTTFVSFDGASQNTATYNILPNTWYMVTFAQSSNNISIYVNGNYIGSSVYDFTGGFTRIGGDYYSTADAWIGQLDEIMIYNKTLNATEIAFLNNSGLGRVYDETKNMFYSKITTDYYNYTFGIVQTLLTRTNNVDTRYTTGQLFINNTYGNNTQYNLSGITWSMSAGCTIPLKIYNGNYTAVDFSTVLSNWSVTGSGTYGLNNATCTNGCGLSYKYNTTYWVIGGISGSCALGIDSNTTLPGKPIYYDTGVNTIPYVMTHAIYGSKITYTPLPNNYTAFNMSLNASDTNASVKLSANNGTNYTQYYTITNNNQVLNFITQGQYLSFIFNLSGNATYSPTISGFGIMNATASSGITPILSFISPTTSNNTPLTCALNYIYTNVSANFIGNISINLYKNGASFLSYNQSSVNLSSYNFTGIVVGNYTLNASIINNSGTNATTGNYYYISNCSNSYSSSVNVSNLTFNLTKIRWLEYGNNSGGRIYYSYLINQTNITPVNQTNCSLSIISAVQPVNIILNQNISNNFTLRLLINNTYYNYTRNETKQIILITGQTYCSNIYLDLYDSKVRWYYNTTQAKNIFIETINDINITVN